MSADYEVELGYGRGAVVNECMVLSKICMLGHAAMHLPDRHAAMQKCPERLTTQTATQLCGCRMPAASMSTVWSCAGSRVQSCVQHAAL